MARNEQEKERENAEAYNLIHLELSVPTLIGLFIKVIILCSRFSFSRYFPTLVFPIFNSAFFALFEANFKLDYQGRQ